MSGEITTLDGDTLQHVFWMGSDSFGRDVLSRTLHGARTSLGLALVATLGALVVGGLLGAWAGVAGGFVERAVLRTGDVLIVLPLLYVVVALRGALPLVLPLWTVAVVLAAIFVALGWPRVARGVWAIVRAEAQEEYLMAAVAAGASRWRGLERCNDFSVGIELEGCDEQPFADAQYAALAQLVRHLRRALPVEDIVGHADIAPGRKTDPGPHFDWARLRQQLDRA